MEGERGRERRRTGYITYAFKLQNGIDTSKLCGIEVLLCVIGILAAFISKLQILSGYKLIIMISIYKRMEHMI